MKIGTVETKIYVRASLKFRPIFYTVGVMWIKFCGGDIHRTSSSSCEFPEKFAHWKSEARPWLSAPVCRMLSAIWTKFL